MSFAPAANSPVQTTWLGVPTADGEMDAYLALPPGGSGPGLLLLQEIFGVNVHIRSVAEQYAAAGFVVLAPDLFWREGRRIELGYVGEERDRALALMRSVRNDQVLADMQASINLLRARPEFGGRLGALGYCMGGRLAFAAAAQCSGVDALVAYYGGGIHNQLELAGRVRCPALFHHAGQDAAIPPSAVADIERAMAERSGIPDRTAPAQFHLYPEAQHGFNCWARAAYHPASAALALGRSLEFLARLF